MTRTSILRSLAPLVGRARAASSAAAPPPPPMTSAAQRTVPSQSLGIADIIARKQAVSADFAELRRATEDLKLGVERTTLGEMLMKKPKHERGHWLWVDSSATVLSAVETMVKANVGAILVMHRTVLDANQDGQVSDEELATANACKAIAGIVTERDYLKKMILQGRDAGTSTVGSIMTSKNALRMADADMPVLDALQLMTEGRFRHLPVINQDKTMLGMASIGDVSKIILEEHRVEVHRLRDFVSGAY